MTFLYMSAYLVITFLLFVSSNKDSNLESSYGVEFLFTILSMFIYLYIKWYQYIREKTTGELVKIREIIYYPYCAQLFFILGTYSLSIEFIIYAFILVMVDLVGLNKCREMLWKYRFTGFKKYPDNGIVTNAVLKEFSRGVYVLVYVLPLLSVFANVVLKRS